MATIRHLPSSVHLPPLFLAGPTASGKSEVALLVAERIGGEIITVDSMQVYRGLDIGTAKPSSAERARVPHHLIDAIDLSGSFDAARFVELARIAEQSIRERKRVPIFCGGTGLYFKAYLEGVGAAPPADAALRAELEATPPAILLRELAENDPATFERVDQRNLRRVIRAVEVIRLTGRPFSAQRAAWRRTADSGPQSPFTLLALSRGNDDLRARIETRVDAMFARGLVDETRELLRHGLERNRTAMQAIGYRQVVEHLRGERILAHTVALVKQRTQQFARRQRTWLRHQLPVKWIEIGASEDPAGVAARVVAEVTASASTRA